MTSAIDESIFEGGENSPRKTKIISNFNGYEGVEVELKNKKSWRERVEDL